MDSSGDYDRSKIKFLSTAADLIATIEGLFAFLSFIVYIKLGNLLFCLIALFLIVFFIFLIIYRKKLARSLLLEFMDLTAPNKIYKITNKFVTYEFLSRTSMQFKNEFYVKPLHDGVDNIVDKYKWSVDQDLQILPITQGHDVQKMDTDSVFGYQQYRIFFNRSYNKEDKPIKTGIVIEDMHDIEKKSLLHLGTGIYDITSTLTLKIIFNSSLQPINIRELEYIHYTDEQHYYCKRIRQAELNEQTGNKEINWVIKHPIYGGKYMIEWDFFEG